METQSEIDFSGKVAVVTGAGRGIGAAIASGFAHAGAAVVVVDLVEERAEETAQRLQTSSRRALGVGADVGSPVAVAQLFDTIRAEFGRLDILVNNAGIWFRKPFLEIADTEWDAVLTTNLKGTFLCTQQAARMMMPQKNGCIINIASHAGLFHSRGQGVHYAASKAGIIQLTRHLSFELGPHQIRINAIAPGGVNTPGSSPMAAGAAAAAGGAGNPLNRKGEPEDIANAALFLASPMAAFMTGQTLVVNGGSIGQP